jgi:hypothetical protein
MFSSLVRGRLAALALSGLVVAGCASMRTSSYVQRGFDIRQYRSYAWGPEEARSTGDPRLDNNRFFDEHVRARVDHALAGKGFEKATSRTPDLLVHYHASIKQQIDVRDLDPGVRYCEESDCGPYVYDAGTLFVDLIDARTNALVWRGWAEGRLDGAIDDQDWMEARVEEAVARILERLPGAL